VKEQSHKRKVNGCIQIISSRTLCLRDCLQNLHDNYNHQYLYPVYVHHFDPIYPRDFQEEVRSSIGEHVEFIQVPYRTPMHVLDKELFYNRRDMWYVQRSFPITRKGYLHMCHFNVNLFQLPQVKIRKHETVLFLDDEGGFTKPVEEDIILEHWKSGLMIGTLAKRYFKPHQGNLDTRTNLFELTKNYVRRQRLTCQPELQLAIDENSEEKFHDIPWIDTYVINTDMYWYSSWKDWVDCVNQYGGIYKYRWGDNDIYSIFAQMYQNGGAVDYPYLANGLYDQGMFKLRQETAPGVQDLDA
jgi:hypothetical protein